MEIDYLSDEAKNEGEVKMEIESVGSIADADEIKPEADLELNNNLSEQKDRFLYCQIQNC